MSFTTSPFLFFDLSESTFDRLVLVWVLVAVILFPVLLKVTPAYGRYAKSTWGPLMNTRAAWVVIEVPAFGIMLYYFWITTNYNNLLIMFGYLLWLMHYLNRAFIYPFRIKARSKKMPLFIVIGGISFNVVNAGLNGYWMAFKAPMHEVELFNSPSFIIGADVFLIGFIINQYHDTLLIRLRRFNTGYKIPVKGWFKYVSCPNYLGEMIEWTGFLILVGSWSAFSIWLWTVINLVTRSLSHHRWYNEKFEHYPKDRKAIIPYLL
jgi:hypothetical protein